MRQVFVVNTQLVATASDARHRPRVRQGEVLAFLKPPQHTCFDTSLRRELRCFDLQMEPSERFVRRGHAGGGVIIFAILVGHGPKSRPQWDVSDKSTIAMPNRREFLSEATCISGILLARFGFAGEVATPLSDDVGSAAAAPAQANSFRGVSAGEQRTVDDIRLCWCPPGRFVMGSPPDEPDHRADEAQVEVTLTKGFWTAKFEVTQGQWRRIVGEFPDKPPTPEFGEGNDFPVYWVNFDEAREFCTKLTERAHRSGALPTGWKFALPTEAQWEYACRAGTVTATSFGADLSLHQANFNGELLNRTRSGPGLRGAARVGTYAANPWDICDMHGNVWEWCQDWYHARLPGGTDPDLRDPKGVPNRDGTYSRVRRGGAWIESGRACRSARRLRYEPPRRSDHIGFRVIAVQL